MSLLVIAVILILIFAGAGLALHVLWWGLIIGVVFLIAHIVSGRNP